MFYAKVFAPRDVDEDCEKKKKKKTSRAHILYLDGGVGGRTYVAPYLIISFLLHGDYSELDDDEG